MSRGASGTSEERRRTWRIGVFTLLAVALMGLAILTVGRKSGLFVSHYRLTAYFDNVQGLTVGQPVWLAGVQVGLVEQVEFSIDRLGKIRVVLAIERAYQDQVRADSKAVLETKGLLGDKIVNITIGNRELPVLEDGAEIQTSPDSGIDAIMNEVARVMSSLRMSMEKVEGVVKDVAAGKGTLGKLATDDRLYRESEMLLAGLNITVKNLNAGQGTAGKIFRDEGLYRRIEGLVGNAEKIVGDVGKGRGTLGKLLTEDEIYDNLVSTTTALEKVAAGMAAGEGTVGKVAVSDELHARVVELTNSLKALADDIKQNPGRYFSVSVFGKKK